MGLRFRSKGGDEYWDEHSVQVPGRLAKQFPREVTILPYYAFFWPTFSSDDLAKLFASPEPIDISRYFDIPDDRQVERAITDEVMYALMELSGQEYVDVYASKAKEESGQAA